MPPLPYDVATDDDWTSLVDELTALDPVWADVDDPAEPAWGFDDPETL